ncbi:valine--tRNA ligase [bacterium]|nr:valine--tRNA ligase [bacterium]
MMELSKTFDSKAAEERWFQLWIDRGYFTADPARSGEPFSIVIPPPNVTGQLHLGHALNVTLQDVIVRMRRMQGFNTLWIPGTDHAGIATQNVVEREIAKQGLTRHDLGREKFVARVWEWKETYGGKILHQLRRLGASCDWSRERFTLDPGLSRAVARVFVSLYREGLIYRGHRMINWCPRCETALSDLEVDHKDARGNLWHIRYPFVDGSGSITVATTRPETMLGDTAVAVNPADDRYRAMVGKTLRLPLAGREIPLIADAAVEREFGTGAVKITPAHDFNDFEIGRRHQLPQISVIDIHGRMSDQAGAAYAGLSREEARKRVVADLEAQGLLEKVEPHAHKLAVCSRCDTVVEPLISEQWFMRMSDLAASAKEAVRDGRTTFHPKHWENTYFAWLDNIQDWCVSRQLWWGHRIPAYWCDRCPGEPPIVAEERPAACPKCGNAELRQDEDVLDTWFSSGLWPFSTLGWPDDTPEMRRYYPTTLLVTGFDIIFFWVARMMMLGLKCAGDIPFRDVYITPLVRDQFGKKMTKSRGNVVDPLEIMERYGTDAVRFTLAQLAVQGRDLILSDDRLAASRAFANKIWNAARFVMMNLDGASQPLPLIAEEKLGLAERWILDRLDEAIRNVTRAIDEYEFNNAAMVVYQFIWHEFCDWYIELAKEPLRAGGERADGARYVLLTCFDRMLRILHPFMPFISEELWQALRPWFPDHPDADHLPIAKWPVPAASPRLSEDERTAMTRCIEATQAINSLRALVGHHPGARVEALLRPINGDSLRGVDRWSEYAKALGKAAKIGVMGVAEERPKRVVFSPLEWAEVGVAVPPEFDSDKAHAALHKKLIEVEVHLERHLERAQNPGFRAKADPETIAEINERIEELKAQRELIAIQHAQLLRLG